MTELQVFDWINGQAGMQPGLDLIMIIFSQALYLVWILVLGLLWTVPGPYRPERRKTAVWSVLAILLSLGLAQMLSFVYYRPRPYLEYDVNVLVPEFESASFPARHPSAASALVAVAGGYSRLLKLIMWPLLVTASYSRVYVGLHYPSDILGGLVVGWLTGAAVWHNRHVLQDLGDRVVGAVERLVRF